MTSIDWKSDEMIELSYVQMSEQGSPGKLVPCEDCEGEEADDTKQRLQEAENKSSGEPDKEKKEDGEPPIGHIEEYNWPVKDDEFEGRDVVVIAVDDTKESEYAFEWYMTILHREENLVVLVHALEIRQRPSGLGLFHKEDWRKERQRILDTRRSLHDKYRCKFIDLKLSGAIVSDKGDSGQFIVDEAKKRKAAYIVTGKRNIQAIAFNRVFFNRSTSDFVVFNSNCTVLVCKMDPKQSKMAEIYS